MTYEFKIRFFNWVNIIVPLLLIPFGFYSMPWVLASLAFYYFIIIVGVDIGLHRLFTHNSFKTSRAWEYILTLLTVPATTGSPMVWSAIHRCHHSNSDGPLDPHSPKKYSVWQLILGLWDAKGLPLKLALPKQFDFKFQKFMHNWYFSLIIAYCAVLALINPALVIYFYVLPSFFIHLHQSFINIFSHMGEYDEGSKDYSNDIPGVGYIFPILGYHHEHHEFPRAHRLGKGKPDIAAFLIEKIFMKKETS